MKANLRKLFLGVFVVGIAIAFSVSCSKDPTTTCIDSTGCNGKTFKTCASLSGGGYYEYNGVKYNYTVSNVTTVAQQLTTAMGCK
jgi:hypothetical protein